MSRVLKTALSAVIALGITNSVMGATPSQSTSTQELEKCYGIAKAGMNDCSTPSGKTCAGSSKMDGEKDAWINLPKGTCNKISGASTTPK